MLNLPLWDVEKKKNNKLVFVNRKTYTRQQRMFRYQVRYKYLLFGKISISVKEKRHRNKAFYTVHVNLFQVRLIMHNSDCSWNINSKNEKRLAARDRHASMERLQSEIRLI